MLKLIFFLHGLYFTLFGFLNVYAQTSFEPPQNAEFKTKDDYAKYENAVSEAAKWLEETDLDKESEKRKKTNAFVVQWVSGSPTVSVGIDENLVNIYGENLELFSLYLASYSRHYIENKASATKFSATKAALISIMKVYKKGIKIIESREMEKLIKLADKDKLDDYIRKKFK